jgi:hypothetical protein
VHNLRIETASSERRAGRRSGGKAIMSGTALRLVQNRSFVGHADDLAIMLLISAGGLVTQFLVLATGLRLPLFD